MEHYLAVQTEVPIEAERQVDRWDGLAAPGLVPDFEGPLAVPFRPLVP